MDFIVIRHGQTDYNAQTRFQGRMDIPLNATGKKQAEENGQKLAELLGDRLSEFDFTSSPLGRARNTMEIIRSKCGLDQTSYSIDQRLIEISFGDWEGRTLSDLQENDAELHAERERAKWTFVPPGENAESYATLSTRIEDYLKSITKPTVCVCHGGVIRAMLHIWGEDTDNLAAIRQIPQDKILVSDQGGRRWI